MEKLPEKTLEVLIDRQGRFEDHVRSEFQNVQEQFQGVYRRFDDVDANFEKLNDKLDKFISSCDARLTILEDRRN